MSQRERNEWIERAKQRVLENAKITDHSVKEIMFLFDEAAWQLETEINAMFQKYATENGLTNAEASKMLTGGEYSRWRKGIDEYLKDAEGDSKTLLELNTLAAKSRISRKEQMLATVYQTMITLSKDTETKLTDLLGDMFKTNYYRGCYDVQGVIGVGFNVSKVDVQMLQRILKHPWSGKNYSQALWENTDKLATLAKRELTMGFMMGSSVQKMAKEINDVMGKGRYAAERLVRTESSYFSNQGELASYREMGIAEYTFLGGGCDDCLVLNGQDFPVDEAEPGLNLPPIHPNCKCTTFPKTGIDLFKDREGVNPLKDNPKFEEWKKKYVKDKGLSATVGGIDGVPEHEEKKLLEQIDFKDTKLVKSRIRSYTEQIVMDNTKENAVCITRSGRVYHCSGVIDSVFPDYDLGDELKGAYVTHNHPISETHYSFSYADINLFMMYKLPELVGTDDEYIYIMRRTPETGTSQYDILKHAYKGENYADFMQKVFDGEMNPDEDEYHYIVLKLAERYGFEYERQKR